MANFNPLTYKITAGNQRPMMATIYRNLTAWIEQHGDFELVVRPHKSKRSVEQNRRLWKIYQVFAAEAWVDGRQYDQEVWHEYLRGEFIGFDEVAMPSGEIKKNPISTTTLKVDEMSEYQNKIQAYGADNFGIEWEF